METKNILLIVIVILVIALACVGAYILTDKSNEQANTIVNNTKNNTNTSIVTNNVTNNTTAVEVNDTVDVNSASNNTTYRVYNPQSDSYETVIGEGYDSEVDRWYTYDSDGVRYYNTRIN